MPAARYIRTLSATELSDLQPLYRQTANADLRSRCQMILLSAQGHPVPEIARLTFFEEDTVLYWIGRYEAENLSGLDASRSPSLWAATQKSMVELKGSCSTWWSKVHAPSDGPSRCGLVWTWSKS